MDPASHPPIAPAAAALRRVRADAHDTSAWWDLGQAMAAARQWDGSYRAFEAALRLDLARRAAGSCVVAINTERRFVGHELPVFQELLARGEDALYLTSCPESWEDLHARNAVVPGRVLLLPLTQDAHTYARLDWSRVRVMVTASVKPALAMPPTTRAVFLTHDVMGFHRTDLPPLAQQDADARRCLAAYASFDAYVVGSEPAAVDLIHRVGFYREQIPAALARPRWDSPQRGLRAGYPRLDAALQPKASAAVRDVILVAPTERGVSCGTWTAGELQGVLQTLADGFPAQRVVFRPHPSEPARHGAEFARLRTAMAARPNFRYDDAIPSPYWDAAAVLVTDTSGTAFTFAFTALRPVVFFAPRDTELREAFPAAHAVALREQLGSVTTSLAQVREAVERALGGWSPGDLRQTRERLVYHVGCAAAAVVDALQEPWPPRAPSADAATPGGQPFPQPRP